VDDAVDQEHGRSKAGRGQDGPNYSKGYTFVTLLGYSMSFIIFGSQVSILGPTIKPLAEQLGVDETDLSPLFTALGISCIVSGTPSGWVVDRFPTHTVLIASLLVEAVGFSLVPFMPSVWSLTALYALICFSYNFTNSAVFTSLGWMFPKRAGGALNLVLAMFGVGSFFIPLAAEACRHYAGTPLAVFWLVGGVSVLSSVPFLFVRSPSPPKLSTHSHHHAKQSKDKTLELVVVSAVVLLVFFTTAAETAIGNWIFTYAGREVDLADGEAALANSMFWGSFTLGRVAGALVSRWTSPAVLLLCSTPFSLLGSALPLVMQGHMSRVLVLATASLAGFGNSTGYANAVALLEQYVPVTGFINGIFGAVAGGACMVGPTLVAMLAKYTPLRYNAMAWVGLAFYALHYPAILTTMAAGRSLLSRQVQARREGSATAAAAGTGDLQEPLLAGSKEGGHAAAAAAAAAGGEEALNGSAHGHSHIVPVPLPFLATNHLVSESDADEVDGDAPPIRIHRSSLPGHAGGSPPLFHLVTAKRASSGAAGLNIREQ